MILKEKMVTALSILLFMVPLCKAGTVDYQYDEFNRLIRASYPDNMVVEYAYDAVGNRVSKTIEPSYTFTFDETKEMKSSGSHGGKIYFVFDDVPANPKTDAKLTIWAQGDLNDLNENITVYEKESDDQAAGITFDGVDDFVEVMDHSSLNLINAITLEVCLNTTAGGNRKGILAKYDNHGYWNYLLYINAAGNVCFSVGLDNVWFKLLTSSSSVNDGHDHYIVATYNKASVRLFIDGREEVSVPETRAMGTGACNVYIGTATYDATKSLAFDYGTGRPGVDAPFKGTISHVRIYSEAITPQEIDANPHRDSLILYHNYSLAHTRDLSGSHHDGTLKGGAVYFGGIIYSGTNLGVVFNQPGPGECNGFYRAEIIIDRDDLIQFASDGKMTFLLNASPEVECCCDFQSYLRLEYEASKITAKLPKTGQTISYHNGDDGDLQIGIECPVPRFVDNGNGTLTDNLTGLMWFKDASITASTTWDNALNYCNVSAFAGYTDWRLPNVWEMFSLFSANNYNPPIPTEAKNLFIDFKSGDAWGVPIRYWVSDSYYRYGWSGYKCFFSCTDFAWDDDPKAGYGSRGFYFIPVRGEPGNGICAIPKTGKIDSYAAGDDGDLEKGATWPSPRFKDNNNGTVTDNLSNLMWTKDAYSAGEAKTWEMALDYCNNLKYAGYDDWHLPNAYELMSIIDFEYYAPDTIALPTGHPFINTNHNEYWTSTSRDANTAYIFVKFIPIDLTYGRIPMLYLYNKSNLRNVWPVRVKTQ